MKYAPVDSVTCICAMSVTPSRYARAVGYRLGTMTPELTAPPALPTVSFHGAHTLMNPQLSHLYSVPLVSEAPSWLPSVVFSPVRSAISAVDTSHEVNWKRKSASVSTLPTTRSLPVS